MISKGALRTVIADQLRELDPVEGSVPRSVFPAALAYGGASALVIKGIRRCGKSTLLKQLIRARFGGDFLYFNFDDERISGFKAEDFQPLMETMTEAFGEKKNLCFDEIQNVPGWELFVNRMLRQGSKVFITGSNANLLSKELGTHLTGRHVDLELWPFSFAEFLRAKGVGVPKTMAWSTQEKAICSRKFKEFLPEGGMPEAVVFSNEAVLTQVMSDIIQKDVVTRHAVRKPTELRNVLRFLVANAGNPITFRSIRNNFGVRSPNTVQKYVEYAEETYLVFTVRRFEKKLKKFDKNPRKIYCADNGLVTKNAPVTGERQGALLENAIAVHLKRMGKEFYYFKGKTGAEADFVVPEEKTAIQACMELTDKNRDREIRGLLEAMKETKANRGLVLTLEQEQESGHPNIAILPAWQWLLENEPRP